MTRGIGGADASATCDGGGCRISHEKEENDILLSLEESVDWHNQTSGFVSSYTLPLMSSGSAAPVAVADDAGEGMNSDQQQKQDATTSAAATATNFASNGLLHQAFALTRPQSLESATSNMTDESEEGDRGFRVGNGISDIFRPPSRSPSGSPRNRSAKSNGDCEGAKAGAGNSIFPASMRSIAPNCTDAASNPPAHPLGVTTTPLDLQKPCDVNVHPPHPHSTSTVVAAAAAAKNATSQDMVRNVIDANSDGRKGVSPVRFSPRSRPRDRVDNKALRRSAKKNNLVIHPATLPGRSRSVNPPSRGQHRPHKSLPPPHPMTNVQSYPPTTAGSPPKGGGRRLSSAQTNANLSCASDAESSAGGSDATPLMSPGLTRQRSLSRAGPEDWSGPPPEMPSARAGGPPSGEILNAASASAEEVGVPDAISTSDLKGVHISFAASGDDDDDPHPLLLSPQRTSQGEPSAVSPLAAPASFDDYRGDDFFAADETHTRQFSSDDRFFEGIHDSGLQSLSFEQVADADLITSRDAEIELVFHVEDGARTLEGTSAGGTSVDGMNCDDEVRSVEEQREMEKRIRQWRRGRNAMMSHSASVESEQHEEDKYEEFTDDDFDNAMELAPLTSSSGIDNHKGNDGNSDESSNGHKNSHSYPTTNNIGWFRWIVRNYIWRWHLRPDQHHGIDLNGRTMRKKSDRSLSPSMPIMPTFNTDGAEDDDDGDMSKGLTTLAAIHSRRQWSKHYDDVDFVHEDRSWFYRCCCCKFCWPNDNFDHSGWKKLLAISSLILLLAWVFSDGNLVKHHERTPDQNYPYDPLAREHFMKGSRVVDDEDDYYVSNRIENLDNNDDDQNYSSHESQYDINDHGAIINGSPIAARPDDGLRTPSQQNIELVGIDTIVVLGSRHTGKDWLIDRLKRLYPDMNVAGEFPKKEADAAPASRAFPRSRTRRRFTRVIDPISKKFLPDEYANTHSARHRKKSTLAHVIVVAVFLNPYDWVELMHVDPDPSFGGAPTSSGGKDWEEFVDLKFPSLGNKTILELRADEIRSTLMDSLERGDVKLVIPVLYEELLQPYGNYDNYLPSYNDYTQSSGASVALPGIIALMDRIQARTGLYPNDSAGWKERSQRINPFWADQIGCSGHVCFMSVNKMREDPRYIQYMNDHVDWEAERLVSPPDCKGPHCAFYQKRSLPKPDVEQIVIVGERHSGAEWLVDRLSRCFPETPVKYGFLGRPGKWFQSQPREKMPNTLVISVFLNSYDWVELMRQHPINAPAHKEMEWAEFVTSPWERKRSNLDNQLADTTNVQCSFGFSFDEIIPCMTQRDPLSDSFPLYELRPVSSGGSSGSAAGITYSNLLGLRADKIRNFLSVAEFAGVVDFISVPYEDLVWDADYTENASSLALPFPGIVGLLEKIRDGTSLLPDVDAGWINDEAGVFTAEALGVGATNLDPYYVQWMEDHVDWDVEMLIGYSP